MSPCTSTHSRIKETTDNGMVISLCFEDKKDGKAFVKGCLVNSPIIGIAVSAPESIF